MSMIVSPNLCEREKNWFLFSVWKIKIKLSNFSDDLSSVEKLCVNTIAAHTARLADRLTRFLSLTLPLPSSSDKLTRLIYDRFFLNGFILIFIIRDFRNRQRTFYWFGCFFSSSIYTRFRYLLVCRTPVRQSATKWVCMSTVDVWSANDLVSTTARKTNGTQRHTEKERKEITTMTHTHWNTIIGVRIMRLNLYM